MAKRRGFESRLTLIGSGGEIKNINPWADSDVGWTILAGGEESKSDEAKYFCAVPWLYRGVKDRANNVAHMPYSIQLNGEEYDIESDPSQALEWFESPTTIFHKIEMSLALVGRAYVKLDVNPSGYIKACRYLVPTSIMEHYDARGVVDYYEHIVKDIKYQLPPEQIVAIYDPDWTTENGPGTSSAAKAALTSAGVLYHTDLFIARYFERGAIKASVLVTTGFLENERLRLQHWWDDVVAGIKNAWAAVVLKGEAVKPTVIGEGLDSLQNETLTSERRQNISTALGVPESRMWSAAANYATRVQDDKAYYLGTIIPDCELIEEAFNEQVFTDTHNLDGYELQFQPETLDIFQADALSQAQAVEAFTKSGYPLLIANDLAGVELTEKQRKELENKEKEANMTTCASCGSKIPKDAATCPQCGAPPNKPIPQQMQPGQPALPAPKEEPANPDMQNALAMWQRKALKRLKESGSAACQFTSAAIPSDVEVYIRVALDDCHTAEDVKAVFALKPATTDEPIHLAITRAVDWLEANA